jgi:glycosyltransferase involved in cell wall biosynthesis
MPEHLKLSIVIPSLNQGEYIEATLASLANQQGIDPEELEIVVIDGGSSDDTPAVLKRWESRLAICVCEPDGGQTDALIKGFALCTGDILGWLCSDDILEPWTVREVIDFFSSSHSVDFVYGNAVWMDREGALLRLKKEIPFRWFIWLHDHNYIPQPAAFWRRGLYELVGGLDPSFDLAMDGDLFARFAEQTRPAHISRQWARLRSYPTQKNKRLRAQSDREDRIIRQRLGVSFRNVFVVGMRYCAAKAWRVAWKVALGAYW